MPKSIAGGGLSALLVGAALLVGGPLAAAAALGGAVVLVRRARHPRTRATAPRPAQKTVAAPAVPTWRDDDDWDVVPAPV